MTDIQKSPNITDQQKEKNQNKNLKFDDVLNRVGFGRYHWTLWVVLGFMGITDGSDEILMSFVLPVLKKELPSDYDLESKLGSCVYFGYLVGSLLSGYFSDNFGRRRPVVYSNFVMVTLGVLAAFPPSVPLFILTRSVFGVIAGIFAPYAYTILAEITPTAYRGKYMVLIGIFYVAGEILVCIVAMITLDSFETGNWHALMGWITVPAFMAFIGSFFFVDESPRQEIVLGRHENGVKILKKMWRINNAKEIEASKGQLQLLSQEEEKQFLENCKQIDEFLDEDPEEKGSGSISYRELFKGKYLTITPIVWYNWFVNTLTFYGVTYLLPLTLSKLNQTGEVSEQESNPYDVGSVIYSCLSELPTVFVAAFVVDMKYFGRKNSMAISFLIGGILCIIASQSTNIVPWISGTKFFFSIAWTLNYQFTSELYPTRIRATAMGVSSAIGCIGGIVMPPLSKFLQEKSTMFPFFFFGLNALVAGILTFVKLFDTTNIVIDDIDEKGVKEKRE